MPIARSFYFIRHGQTDWNVAQRLQGHTDISLNEIGREQAQQALKLVANLPIDLIVASDLSRARETAEIINNKLQLPIIEDPRIKERHFGDLEGKTSDEATAYRETLKLKAPELIEPTGYPPPPNGEVYPDFKGRIITSLNEHLDSNPNKNILFTSHGGVYSALHRTMFNERKHSDNACPYLFEKQDSEWNLIKL